MIYEKRRMAAINCLVLGKISEHIVLDNAFGWEILH